MKTKPASHAPEQMAPSTNQTFNHGRLGGSPEKPRTGSKGGESEWLKNAKMLLSEMQEDSERFRKGIAEEKQNLKALKTGLKELDERNTLTDKGIASVRIRILEMESELAKTRAAGFEAPRSSKISERDGVIELGTKATASDTPVTESPCNELSAEIHLQTPDECLNALIDKKAAEERMRVERLNGADATSTEKS
ncbi:hypothetical protein H2200_008432 [Cladophialophora chaetospira]|uniref:Uncharacterized protein n=1 Tax=Cladophialophora chaetospira TaxID=386627 RepID=A0AA39CG38_9EURO|nr:hypothetical protein H2200_008432 [Cladophialophora chaetospira]